MSGIVNHTVLVAMEPSITYSADMAVQVTLERGRKVVKQQNSLLAAAGGVAEAHFEQMVVNVITCMCNLHAADLFDSISARHAWDEYCWSVQEGPYDDNSIGFGSTAGNLHAIAEALIDAEIFKLSAPSRNC